MTIEPAMAAQPRRWTFLDKDSGDPVSFTCMPGCVIRHDITDEGHKRNPDEIMCWTAPNGTPHLPIDSRGIPENSIVLSAHIEVKPTATSMADRLPHVSLEFVEDQHITGLDPDSLAVVISVLAERVEALRRTHADLLRLRAAYLGQLASEHAPCSKAQVSPVMRAWDAIEAVFAASEDAELTRKGLRQFVDATAAKSASGRTE